MEFDHNQTTQTRTNEGKNNTVWTIAQPIKVGDQKHIS